jgi:hypothetical protein
MESFILVFIHFKAVWQLLLVLNPWDELLKFNSNIGSMIERKTSWTSLSFIDGIPKGLNLPAFPGLGINNSLTPSQANLLVKTASLSYSILFLVRSVILSLSGPGVLAPLFFLSFK